MIKNTKVILLILLVIVIASFFRLYNIESIPPGVYPDEAINANNGITAVWEKDFKVFYPYNNGREGLFMNLIGISTFLFGISVFSIKLIPALIGILTILGIYLLTKELFSYLNEKYSQKIALFSSLFASLSFWHINFSRIVFRGIFVPFILVFSFYFLFQGMRNKKALSFILSGSFLGLGLHTYISARLAPVIFIPVFLIFFLIFKKKKELKKFFINCFYFFASAFIVALPLFYYFYKNPGDFTGRATNVSVFSQSEPIKGFLLSLVRHLGAFNISGDYNWRHNYAGTPLLSFFVGIFFIIGIIISIKKIFESLRKKDLLKLNVFFLLFVWFFIMLLPGALTFEGIPHALRIIGVIPVAFIFSGIGLFSTYAFLKKLKTPFSEKKKTILINFLLIFVFLFSGFYTYQAYFNDWGKRDEVKGSFAYNYVKIGNYLNSLSNGIEKYVIVEEEGIGDIPINDMPMSPQTSLLIERIKKGKETSTYIWKNEIDKINIKNKGIILPLKHNEELVEELKKRFPQLEVINIDGFFVYSIK